MFNCQGAWAGANYSQVSVEEDLQFVSDLLDEIRAEYCVDDSRIYATGQVIPPFSLAPSGPFPIPSVSAFHGRLGNTNMGLTGTPLILTAPPAHRMSNGGTFVNVIACSSDVGGRFAAFAPASGAYYHPYSDGAACSPARTPLPMLSIHGGRDTTVPYEGGEGSGGLLPSIPEWLDQWAERNGCADKTVEDSFDGDVHHSTWACAGSDGAAQGLLQHWKVDSMGELPLSLTPGISPLIKAPPLSFEGTFVLVLTYGQHPGHCWASTEINFSQIAAGEGPTHIQASEIIMQFFDQHTKACG